MSAFQQLPDEPETDSIVLLIFAFCTALVIVGILSLIIVI